MIEKLIIASTHGVMILRREGDTWRGSGGAERNHRFTSIASRAGIVLAGAVDGVFYSVDGGSTWWQPVESLPNAHVRWLALHPDDQELGFAGTEPAAIFRTQDHGQTWQECPEVAQLRDKHSWSLPYSPRAGCVRGFAFQGQRGYAAVEQGGLLRSDDRGYTWQLVEGSSGDPHAPIGKDGIHSDVHSVVIHPSSPDQVYAPTGGGFYYSTSGGRSWDKLHPRYCRAVWVDPQRPAHMILGIADGPDRNGRIVESIDGGEDWIPRMEGLSPVWERHMVERFTQVDDELWAVLSNGEVIAAPLESLEWRTTLDAAFGASAIGQLSE